MSRGLISYQKQAMTTDSKSSNLIRSKTNTSAAGPSSSKSKIDSSASKKKMITKKTSKTVTKTVPKTREKKVYSLAGQKYDVPEEREPLRIFYESLSKQIPSSEMAEFWLMEHGLLSPEKAKKAFDKKQRKQKQIRSGTPVKSPPPRVTTKPEISKKPQQQLPKNGDMKAQKRILQDSDDDDDFVLSHKRRKV